MSSEEHRSFGGGRYRVQRELGRGGQKVVFLVRDEQLDRLAALSLIHADALDARSVERLEQEARILARMGAQPHVVTVFDIGEDAGRPFIVTEYMEGGDLAGEVARHPDGLPVDRALAFVQDILQALVVLHERGVVHRDLKPNNVWLDGAGRCKLGDFGLALAPDRARLTQSNAITGTPAYVSPEQLENRPLDGRADLYSLGCVAYELLTGRPPFEGPVVSVISQHLHAVPVAPSRRNPALSEEIDRFVLSLLAKDPSGRPASARAALEKLAVRGPPAAVAPPPEVVQLARADTLIRHPAAPSRRPAYLGVAALAIALALALAGAAAVAMSRRAPPPSMHTVVVLAVREPSDTMTPTVAWSLTSRLIETIDRYQEFRPVAHAGLLTARIAVLGDASRIPDEAMAPAIARRVGADTVAALSVAKAASGALSVAIHVFAADEPGRGVATPRQTLSAHELDGAGPARLGEAVARALARQWKLRALVDEMGGMPLRPTPFEAYELFTSARNYCLLGRFDQCERLMWNALERDPDHPLFHAMLACAISYQGGRDAEVEEHARRAHAQRHLLTSRRDQVLFDMELAWLEAEGQKDPAAKKRAGARVLALSRQLAEVWMDPWGYMYGAAATQYFLEDIPAARALYAQARSSGPSIYFGYWEEAKLLYGDGKSREARAEAARLMWTYIECFPGSELAPFARAQTSRWDLARPQGDLPCPRVAGAAAP